MPNLVANIRYQGPRGFSAFEVAVKNGYTGTEEEWVAMQMRGVKSIVKDGTGAAGTVDTYTITFVDDTTYRFQVYNGRDGIGTGDMLKAVYDANGNGIVDNAEKVNGHTVLSDVPENANFITDVEKTYINTTVPSVLENHNTRIASNEQNITNVVNSMGTQVTYTLDGTSLTITTKE